MTDCIFCNIVAGEMPAHTIWEDGKTLVFLNIRPISRGHLLIIPKRHAENLADGQKEDARSLMDALYDIAPKIMEALGAQGYNLGMNHGEVAGQEVFHTHLHVIPRYKGEPRNFEKQMVSDQELREIANIIKKAL